jgi:hypothetical protein
MRRSIPSALEAERILSLLKEEGAGEKAEPSAGKVELKK